eukprot:g2208.t1
MYTIHHVVLISRRCSHTHNIWRCSYTHNICMLCWYPQALFAYTGPSFQAIGATSLSEAQRSYLNQRLRIISGLYGVVRPFDMIQPYRLCMGSKMNLGSHKNLYSFWGGQLADFIIQEKQDGRPEEGQKGSGDDPARVWLINVASEEYSKAVLPFLPSSVFVVTCQFLDSGRVLSVFAKRARGLLVRWAALHNVAVPSQLQDFDTDGYKFDPKQSRDDYFVFGRNKPSGQSKQSGGKKRQSDGAGKAKQDKASEKTAKKKKRKVVKSLRDNVVHGPLQGPGQLFEKLNKQHLTTSAKHSFLWQLPSFPKPKPTAHPWRSESQLNHRVPALY